MRFNARLAGGVFAAGAALSLAACGDGATEPEADNTVVTDMNAMDGTVDDTTVIDGTLGSEEDMGMENSMPADSAEPTMPDADSGAVDPPTNAVAPAEEE